MLHRSSTWPHGAVWPLPEVQGRRPFATTLREPCAEVAIAYAPEVIVPGLVPVLAISEAVIAFASDRSLVLDHGRGWATHYNGLRHVFATPTLLRRGRAERVKTGDVLGYASTIYFAIWRLDDASHYEAIDPRPILERCLLLPHTEARAAEVPSWTP